MFTLKLFGGASLDGPGGAVAGRAGQRQRLALLALLAASGPAGMSRDKLIAYLWPEADADRGRHLLSNSLYVMRQALGEDAIVASGDVIRLDGERVTSDVRAFEEAIAGGELERAAGAYAGPFLDGFFLPDAPEFERWVEQERDRLAAARARVLEGLAEQAERGGDAAGAVEWWKRRAAHDPFDSRIALRLMRALDAAGNPAGALQHASIHERLLREEMDIAPPAELAALAARLRAEGVKPAAVPAPRVPPAAPGAPAAGAEERAGPSSGVAAGPAADAPTEPRAGPPDVVAPPVAAVTPPARPAAPRPRARWMAAAALLLVVALGAIAWTRRPDPAAPEPSIVVLPFADLSESRGNAWFAGGLTEEITARLAAVPGLEVISRTSAVHYEGRSTPVRTIASELGVAHVLEGSVRESGGRVRVTAQLVDARRDVHRWAKTYDVERRDVIEVQEEIARQVVEALRLQLGDEAARQLAARGTADTLAYELYRRGRYHWSRSTRQDHPLAIAYFEQAIARDSGYAEAWAGLADSYLQAYQLRMPGQLEAEAYTRQKWAAERALAIDERSSEAHTSFAVSLWWQQNWAGAERELRRALELAPGNTVARRWLALLLAGMGRVEEANDEARVVARLDPLVMPQVLLLGWSCYMARDFDCAAEQYRRVVEMGDRTAGTHAFLGLALARLGRFADAHREVRKAVEVADSLQRPTYVLDVAIVHALAGDTAEARRTVRRARAMGGASDFVSALAFAEIGEADSAFALLERAPWKWPHRALRADPALDRIRSDPRFVRLSARIDREMGVK